MTLRNRSRALAGWLDNFKKRYQIKGIRCHSEVASINEGGMAIELVSSKVIEVVRALRAFS